MRTVKLDGVELKFSKEWSSIFDMLDHGDIPKRYPLFDTGYSSSVVSDIVSGITNKSHLIRDCYTDNYGFSLVSMDWVEELKESIIKDGRCLEVMSGSGILSKALQSIGVDVIATDNDSWADENYPEWHNTKFTDIEIIDAVDAVNKYGHDIDFIIMSWPPFMYPTAYNVLKAMREVNSKCRLIFIGEDAGGCTADDDFFEAANVVDDVETNVALLKVNGLYKRFPGIHDRVFIIK